jgi:DHA2 family multidrug resistance protein
MTAATATATHREVANRGLLVVSVMLATLMQALDTTIANVALPNMQGSLSATQDQISWVLTSYIVAAAIATPATGWLASVMGRRRLLLIAIAGFTLASVLCGIAGSIGQMVAFRLLQGLFGAALVPLSQSTLLDVYPREKHGSAMALWGMGVMVGPILGPPLGGWLTDAYSWHWVFLINVPICALALFGVAASLPTDDTRASRFDWRGFAFLAIGIGALQLMLDRGELKDWFGSAEIQIEAALAFLGFYLYGVHWYTSKRSFLDLGLFRDRNFLASNIFIFVLGVVLFATMALLPPFLQNLMNYPVITTGMLLAPRGIGTLIAMMVVGRLLARGADARLLAAIGMTLTAYSLWQMAHWSTSVPEAAIVWCGVLQGLGLGLVFVPISTVAYSTLPMAARTEAAGIFSLMRNIGSSVGISIVMALLSRGTQINHAELAGRITPFDAAAAHLSTAMHLPQTAAMAALNGEITRQASAIAFLNDFWMMMIMTVVAIPLLLLLRPVRQAAAPAVVADH